MKSPSLSSTHVAEMDADPELDPPRRWQASIALHMPFRTSIAAHSIDNAAKFYDAPVASALDDAAMMDGDGWID